MTPTANDENGESRAAARLPCRLEECLQAAGELERAAAAYGGTAPRPGPGLMPAYTALLAKLSALSWDLDAAGLAKARRLVRPALDALAEAGARLGRTGSAESINYGLALCADAELGGLRGSLEALRPELGGLA